MEKLLTEIEVQPWASAVAFVPTLQKLDCVCGRAIACSGIVKTGVDRIEDAPIPAGPSSSDELLALCLASLDQPDRGGRSSLMHAPVY